VLFSAYRVVLRFTLANSAGGGGGVIIICVNDYGEIKKKNKIIIPKIKGCSTTTKYIMSAVDVIGIDFLSSRDNNYYYSGYIHEINLRTR